MVFPFPQSERTDCPQQKTNCKRFTMDTQYFFWISVGLAYVFVGVCVHVFIHVTHTHIHLTAAYTRLINKQKG